MNAPPASAKPQVVLDDDAFCLKTQNILKNERVRLWPFRHHIAELEGIDMMDARDLVNMYGKQLSLPGEAVAYAKCMRWADTVDRLVNAGDAPTHAFERRGATEAVDECTLVSRLLRMHDMAIQATERETSKLNEILEAIRDQSVPGGRASSDDKTPSANIVSVSQGRFNAMMKNARDEKLSLPTTDRNLPGRKTVSLAVKQLSIDVDVSDGPKFQGWHTEQQYPLTNTADLDGLHPVPSNGACQPIAVARALCLQIRAYRIAALKQAVPAGYANIRPGVDACCEEEGERLEEYLMLLAEELDTPAMLRMASSFTTHLHAQTHFPFNNSISKAWSGALEMLASLRMNRDVYGSDSSSVSDTTVQRQHTPAKTSPKPGTPSKSAIRKEKLRKRIEDSLKTAGSPINPSSVPSAVPNSPLPKTTYQRLPGGNPANPQKCNKFPLGTCTGPCFFSHA